MTTNTIRVIHSQIGYDIGKSKKAYVTGLTTGARFIIINAVTKQTVYTGELRHWGEKWNESWWIADFSSLDTAGEYNLQVTTDDQTTVQSSAIHIGRNILWNQCWHACSVAQLDVRAANSYPVGGWRDCGSELQEVSSHIIMLGAVCDLLADLRVPACEIDCLQKHVLRGADYIVCCQRPDGGFVHEVKYNPNVSYGNCANAVAILARTSVLANDFSPANAQKYLCAAQRGYEFLLTHDFFSELQENPSLQATHGAPEGMLHPPEQHRTRDLLSLLDATLSLCKAGKTDLKDSAIALVREILDRQIPTECAEYGFYGHFYTYPGYTFSEKANYHCGAWHEPYKDYNQGAHKPYWVLPVFEAVELFPDHPDAARWKAALYNFAYGFFLPVCKTNPFGILPAGIYTGMGVLYFSGWYHGHAKIYGYAAALAMKFYAEWNDPAFLEIADANMQWIAGLNCGNISLVVGIGDRCARDWDALRGTIINGFDASKQFSIAPVSAETDLPEYLDDEGGIHHCAGFVTGLCATLP